MSPEFGLTRLDALASCGAITGYTVEPDPAYLSLGQHILTYSVYGDDRAGRRNIARLVRDLAGLGARMDSHLRIGTVSTSAGLQRTRELGLVARLPDDRRLDLALDLVCELHAAGGSRPRAGSWLLPDVRVCGSSAIGSRTVPAFAHEAPVGSASAVVITLDGVAPLPGMRTHPVRVLDCWAPYLEVAAG